MQFHTVHYYHYAIMIGVANNYTNKQYLYDIFNIPYESSIYFSDTVDVSSTNEIRLQMSSNNEIFEVCPDRPLNIIIQRCTECYGFYIER